MSESNSNQNQSPVFRQMSLNDVDEDISDSNQLPQMAPKINFQSKKGIVKHKNMFNYQTEDLVQLDFQNNYEFFQNSRDLKNINKSARDQIEKEQIKIQNDRNYLHQENQISQDLLDINSQNKNKFLNDQSKEHMFISSDSQAKIDLEQFKLIIHKKVQEKQIEEQNEEYDISFSVNQNVQKQILLEEQNKKQEGSIEEQKQKFKERRNEFTIKDLLIKEEQSVVKQSNLFQQSFKCQKEIQFSIMPYQYYLQQKESLFIENYKQKYQQCKQFESKIGLLSKQNVLKIQNQIQKDQYNKNKKTIVFDFEGILLKIFDNEIECNNYDYYIQAYEKNQQMQKQASKSPSSKPHLLNLLLALKPFFELVIYTNRVKQVAEQITQKIEQKETIFTFIIPGNFLVYSKSEKLHFKDMNILLGNRSRDDIIIVSNQPYDSIKFQENTIPLFPFYGDDSDFALQLLEQYLVKLRWIKDIRQTIANDFDFVYS